MFSNILCASCLLSVFTGLTKPTNGATAVFSNNNNGLDGSVDVNDGVVTVNIDFSNLDTSLIGGSECFADGFSYHIHEKWDHSDNNDKIGSTNCGSTYTGGHWDPWIGCGSATGNVYCSSKGGCVTGSSILSDNPDYMGDYDCNSVDFTSNPYICEVGDWSGKYGKVTLDDDDTDQLNLLSTVNFNAFEVDGTDLSGKSVVFHCGNDGSRAFCAPFTDTDTDDDSNSRPPQSSVSKIAKFDTLDDTSMIILENSGEYEISFDISRITLPHDCGDHLLYRIYNDWTDENSLSGTGSAQCMIKGIEMFYDPTVTCAQDSDATAFCDENGLLCGDNSYAYNCDFANARYSCAPGDLSGKYGIFAVDTVLADATSFETSGIDELMIDLSLIEGKSAVLQCSDTYEVVACAQFRDYDKFIPSCPDSCVSMPCSCSETTNCNVCHDRQGCSQCENGYFQSNSNTQCSDCQIVFGKNCLHCGNQNGCQQCAQEYFRVYDMDCGLYYCL